MAPLLVAGPLSAAPAGGHEPADSCQEASTTLAMQDCLQAGLERLERQLNRYLDAARGREAQLAAEESRPAATLAATQRIWHQYRDAHCQDVERHWSGGSIRGVMVLSCRQALARERLRRIWQDYLTFPDGSPPLLPDPAPQAVQREPLPDSGP